MIRNIIWDLDGTLFDTYPAIIRAFRKALKDFGIRITQEEITRKARGSLTLYGDALVHEHKLDQDSLRQRYLSYYDEFPVTEQKPFSGVREVCDHIISLGGFNVIVTHRRWDSAKKLLEHYKMNEFFKFLMTVDEGYPLKPDPTMFEKVIQSFDLLRNETLAVGDRDLDIYAGKAEKPDLVQMVRDCYLLRLPLLQIRQNR